MIPSWWEFTLLVLAAYRVWRLLSEDTILDRPRAWLLGVPGWKPVGDETPPAGYRERLATFLTCPWCAGFWLSLLVWAAWLLAPYVTLVAATPWAVSAVVATLGARLG